MKKPLTQSQIKKIVTIVVLVLAIVIGFGKYISEKIPDFEELRDKIGVSADIAIPDGTFEMQVVDVGNADCIVLRQGDETMLIDAGEAEDVGVIEKHFLEKSIGKLKYVLITHAHDDHIGGMRKIIEDIPVETFLMEDLPEEKIPSTRVYEHLLETLDEKNIHVEPLEAKTKVKLELGKATVELFTDVTDSDEQNEQSVVAYVTFGKNRFLLMGDAGKESERYILQNNLVGKADVLKLGHHGSNSASCQDFLDAVSPRYAAVTCGLHNRYGHPSDKTLERVKRCGTEILRCDKVGTIIFTSDGKNIQVTTEEE